MNLQDGISIGEALIVTVFSMLLVFVTLIAISLIVSGFKYIGKRGDKNKQAKNNKTVETDKRVDNIDNRNIAEENQEDELELIAVITASIAATLSRPTSSIVVKNIVRVPQSTPVWGSVSRQEMVTKNSII